MECKKQTHTDLSQHTTKLECLSVEAKGGGSRTPPAYEGNRRRSVQGISVDYEKVKLKRRTDLSYSGTFRAVTDLAGKVSSTRSVSQEWTHVSSND